jgi:hypothetical protein
MYNTSLLTNRGKKRMKNFTIDELLDYTLDWIVTGNLNPAILAESFHFISPFWQSNDRDTFLSKFLDPTEYQEKSLSNIIRFDPIVKMKSDDQQYFSLIFRYHTKYDVSVDEAVFGTINNSLLTELRSIYDLEKTKKAHQL